MRANIAHRVRLRARDGDELPYPMDRLPVFGLSAVAVDRSDARIEVVELARWLGKAWRKREASERLRRLLDCRIDIPTVGGKRRFRIADWYSIDDETGLLEISFAKEFRTAAQRGAHVPLAHLRGLAGRMFVLEVYTWLRLLLHDGQFSDSWNFLGEIRPSGNQHSFAARLRSALQWIRRVWPESPFRSDGGTSVACDRSAFRLHAFGFDVEKEKRTRADELAGKTRTEVREHILQQPEWRRAPMFIDYIYEHMRPRAQELVARTSTVTDQAAAIADSLDAMTEKLQQVSAIPSTTVGGADSRASDVIEQAENTPGLTSQLQRTRDRRPTPRPTVERASEDRRSTTVGETVGVAGCHRRPRHRPTPTVRRVQSGKSCEGLLRRDVAW